MKLNQIRDVLAVVEHGCLRHAAQELGLAQPAMTRSIRELEHELGAPLFDRQTRGMVLTAAGEAFVRRARVIQSEIQRSQEEIAQLKGAMTGHVSIGLSMGAHIAYLPDVIAPFLKCFTGVRLRIVEGLLEGLRGDIATGDLDFYVGPVFDEPLGHEFHVDRLVASERVILCRIGHPLRQARRMADLVSARWVGPRRANHPDVTPGKAFAQFGLPNPTVDVETPSALTTIVVAANSDLLAFLPRQWLRHPWMINLLERIPIAEPVGGPDMCLVRRASLPLTPAAEHMADLFARAALSEERNWGVNALT